MTALRNALRAGDARAPMLNRNTSPSSDVPFQPPKTYIHTPSELITAECAERFPGAESDGVTFFHRSVTVSRMCTSRKRSMSSFPPKSTSRSPDVQIVWHSRFVGAAGSCFVSIRSHAMASTRTSNRGLQWGRARRERWRDDTI